MPAANAGFAITHVRSYFVVMSEHRSNKGTLNLSFELVTSECVIFVGQAKPVTQSEIYHFHSIENPSSSPCIRIAFYL